MSWLQEIKNHRKKKYSQCGEEGFIEFILKNLGIESGNILELARIRTSVFARSSIRVNIMS